MILMTTSPTKDVDVSRETKRVNEHDLHLHDKPLRNPPPVRRGVTLPLNLWTSDLYRIQDSVRHCHAPVYPTQPAPEVGTSRQLFAALEKKLQQVRIEVDTVMSALQTATTHLEEVEKERDEYKLLAHRNGMRYSRMMEERVRRRASGSASSQECKSEPPPYAAPPPLGGDESRLSSVGPSRRDSTLKARRQSWETYPLRSRTVSGSDADSRTSSEGDSPSFAVTSIAPPLPAQTIYGIDSKKKKYELRYVRDASRPTRSPRPAPPPYGRDEIGIYHIDLMYEPSVTGRISCRACRRNVQNESDATPEVTNFACDADWEELREHYVTEHSRACQEIARLTPDELNELRRYGIVPSNGRR